MPPSLFLPHVIGTALSVLASLLSGTNAQAAPRTVPPLAAPFVFELDGEPFAFATGHAAPLLYDIDGDGIQDLVVGEFGDQRGRVHVFRNSGSATEPRFSTPTFLQADGADATVRSA